MVNSVVMPSFVRVLSDSGPFRLELARWKGRLVVVKKLRGLSPELARRIRREAEVAARLRHPNIIPLLGCTEEALVYEYRPGRSLATLLGGPRLGPELVLRIMDQLLRALECAHAGAVVHHDVKPGNIVMEGDRALLTDFGFAKDLALASITGEHQLLGTPAYMAPEQFQGRRGDHRSDLYAAGAVLHHMVEGEPPHGADVLRFLLGESDVSPVFSADTPEELVPVLDTALAYSPAARFQSAAEFRAVLAGALAGGNVPA